MCIDKNSNKKPTKKYKIAYKVVKLRGKKFNPWYYDDMTFELGQNSPPLSKNEFKTIDGEGYHLFVHLSDAINWRPFLFGKTVILKCLLGEVIYEATDDGLKTLIVKSFIPIKQLNLNDDWQRSQKCV